MEYQKATEAAGDLICNKIADVVRSKTLATRAKSKVSKSSPQNNSETIANKHDEKIPQRYISTEERQKIIKDLTFNITI